MSRTLLDLAGLLAVLAVATAIAAALGAANFGHALTYGELAFSAALIWLLMRR